MIVAATGQIFLRSIPEHLIQGVDSGASKPSTVWRQVATAKGGYGDRIGSYPVAIGDYFTIRTCGGIQVPSSTDCSAQ